AIGLSSAATPAQASFAGNVELAIIDTAGHVQTSRINPANAAPTWFPQAALPNGVVPFGSLTALGATACCLTGSDREKLFVVGSDLQLYQMTSIGTSGSWPSSWAGPYVSQSGYVASIGTVTKESSLSSYQPRVFGAVGVPNQT